MHPGAPAATATGPGPLALVGSGEYLPVMADLEGMLIEGRPRRYVQIPAAAAPEGRQRLQVHGRQHAWRLDGGPRRRFPAGARVPA